MSGEEREISNREVRFLMTVCANHADEDFGGLFIIKTSKHLGVAPWTLISILKKEMDDDVEFKAGKDVAKPGTFPRIFGEIQSSSIEATKEREKLEMVADIVRYGTETVDDILALIDMPVVYYCWFCKQFGYNKDHYLNHNFRGGHNNEIICPATYFMHAL